MKTENRDSFTSFVFSILETQRSSISRETYYTYRASATKLVRFKSNVCFSDLNESFIGQYREWMLRNGNNENTASKTLRTLRTWVNLAVRHERIIKNPFQYIRIKKVDGRREFLNQQEFNSLYDAYQCGRYIGMKQEVLKCFLFSCTTGLRYGDVKRLRWSDVRESMISISMHKTSLPVTVPISQKAATLMGDGSRDGFVFRTYCNKVTNRILKSIIKEMGISKKVTFHVARHTFATISITIGIPVEVVSKLLGHTDLKTTQIYAKVVDTVKVREMNKWDRM